ncbi:hypothetical protein A3A64_01275 [Candidatus Gottesmanbacteria bacterium RIFCSPLOWO2_01_FULL_48_11]|uniref:OmpR/PhoB-type domain-containing protein n=3 Tax=Candidatus Gottesmaniibacteriota TaxID=1752720 RepID=A0A0G1UQJ8_9BACT|nr:MAG: hypothetical protein UY16_C0015G0022 [Candidatus Gottesmanbacteria bacterium GW2011_GWA2_47_9]KKU96341.1 MAG: hypothetical protein UY27_C0001G0034 [Candidatus Gottesmanbacteria bacterium GW2011_GWA1_48_13]OGG28093.1 MAG: hypothetical protein A3A64_01275 [Candidatus Gottesmanbacteria bacterium RIFCSPLOWO2_01_FULL_48_11]
MKHAIEATYPVEFREADAQRLGAELDHHDSVVLMGMKRVGISNFLRFFLNHPAIGSTYIKNDSTQLFIIVDLNDLVERDVYPFWTLVLTRIVDSIQKSGMPEAVKRESRRIFVKSIQLKDLFFTVESVRKLIGEIHQNNIYPTIFLMRFDRIGDIITPELFNNLQGLKEVAKQKLSYVFTSFRPLYELSPTVLTKSSLSVFAHDMYLAPAKETDSRIILGTLMNRYHASISEKIADTLVTLSGGHVQYLHLALLRMMDETSLPADEAGSIAMLARDEQIHLLSEELFDSFTKGEKDVLLAVHRRTTIDDEARRQAAYLWNTGVVGAHGRIFSPLFAAYLETLTAIHAGNGEFTKKEHLLFGFLKSHEGNLCEREAIIEAVWPESKDLGVSDWAIDRLVARVRSKLKHQGNIYEVMTVKTRGYKLTNHQ